MLDWLLLFLGGLLGSTHCVGMCGGMAVTLGWGSPGWRRNLQRQLAYSAGRVFTYSIAGAVLAAGGLRLSRALESWGNPSAWLAIVAGVVLIVQGLLTARVFATRSRSGALCLTTGLFRGFLTAPGWENAFAAGMLTGFLPCGLLYGFLALAASSRQPLAGAAMMAVFAAGTMPLMLLVGLGASTLQPRFRNALLMLAAVCVIVTGSLSLARGIDAATKHEAPACPFCRR